MKRVLFSLFWLCVLALAYSQPVEAGMFVTISANGESVSCDNGSGRTFSSCRVNGFITNPRSNVITFSGSVGGYQFVNLTVTGNPPGDTLAFVTDSKTTITHISGPGDLTVDFGAYDFTLPSGPGLFLSASATANWTTGLSGDRANVQAWARPDKVE